MTGALMRESTYVDLIEAVAAAAPDVPCTKGRGWISDELDEQRDAARSCGRCPAIVHCQRYIAENPELGGVWAGLTEKARIKLARQEPLARADRAYKPERQPMILNTQAEPQRKATP